MSLVWPSLSLDQISHFSPETDQSPADNLIALLHLAESVLLSSTKCPITDVNFGVKYNFNLSVYQALTLNIALLKNVKNESTEYGTTNIWAFNNNSLNFKNIFMGLASISLSPSYDTHNVPQY